MRVRTKQRLIGGLVLVAILAIFLPLIFHNTRPIVGDRLSQKQPTAPSMPKIDVQMPKLSLSSSSATPAKKATVDAQSESAVARHPRKTSDLSKLSSDKNLPKAWTLQLGTFADKKNVDHLLQKLRQSGYDAYARELHGGHGKMLHQVYVGPEIDKQHIIELQKQLQKQFHLKGVIKLYTV